jgi:hypothetical protein
MRFLRPLVISFLGLLATACHRMGSCEPADVNGISRTCSGSAGWVWTGTSCIFSQKCVCTGDDCNSMYANRDVCEAAHTHCSH